MLATFRVHPNDPPMRVTAWICSICGLQTHYEYYDIESGSWVSCDPSMFEQPPIPPLLEPRSVISQLEAEVA